MAQRILVIDDNDEILDMFHDLLSGEEYDVILSDFVDPEVIAQIQPDLLILDYLAGQQPVGGRVIRQLRQQPTTKNIPVLVCTTASMVRADQEAAFAMERVRVVTKPFNVAELLETIKHVLDENGGTSRMVGS